MAGGSCQRTRPVAKVVDFWTVTGGPISNMPRINFSLTRVPLGFKGRIGWHVGETELGRLLERV